ncbi:maleylacetate reductase [Corynebacterium kalidii]|uniref:Maleylacetate reductase n=1 Tax=Corynebacterium kalidii TaxID=2931982 RepID=A0A9X1WG75_9CORY|nr:maleylacetate reductase [Corynebacterium kalidii]MCJ7858444.1 maleylacetate reductase [Corynebacterium kalidii]
MTETDRTSDRAQQQTGRDGGGPGGEALSFTHVTAGQRVLFGSGSAAAHLAAEVDRLGARSVMVIASERERALAGEVTAQVEVALWHTDVVMHVPVETAAAAREAAQAAGIDLVVCVGGGSTTGLAKAVALTGRQPIVAVPTTYAGSEATNVWGLTEDGRKTTGVDDAVLPVSVIYDASLTVTLPVEMSVASGLNGLAHCVDSLWAPRADPINAAMAAEGIRALSEGLPLIVDDPRSTAGRDLALYGAYLSAVAFSSAGSGLHHKICHVLGGTFDLPHAQTHAIVLPYVLAFNGPAAPAAEARAAQAFGAATALSGLDRLRDRVGAPRRLADLGFTAADIPVAVDIVLQNIPAGNPRTVTVEGLTALLHAALDGSDPADTSTITTTTTDLRTEE